MGDNISIAGIVKTSIVTALTIAAALIWKDFIENLIKTFVEPSQALKYQFIAAIIATIFVIISIYLILQAESEVEHLEHFVSSKYQEYNQKKLKSKTSSKVINKTQNDASKQA